MQLSTCLTGHTADSVVTLVCFSTKCNSSSVYAKAQYKLIVHFLLGFSSRKKIKWLWVVTYSLLPALWLTCAGESSSNEEEEPAQKKKRDQLRYIQSEEFQKILNAKSRHDVVLQAVRSDFHSLLFDVKHKNVCEWNTFQSESPPSGRVSATGALLWCSGEEGADGRKDEGHQRDEMSSCHLQKGTQLCLTVCGV